MGQPQEKQATGCMQAQEQCMNFWQKVFFEMLHRQHGVHAAADSADAAVKRYKQRRDQLSKTSDEPPKDEPTSDPTSKRRRELAAQTLQSLRVRTKLNGRTGLYTLRPQGAALDDPLAVVVEVEHGRIKNVRDVGVMQD